MLYKDIIGPKLHIKYSSHMVTSKPRWHSFQVSFAFVLSKECFVELQNYA